MTLDAIVREIRLLPIDERRQVIIAALNTLTEEIPTKPYNIRQFRGAASHLRDVDAQEYLNQLRDEA
jgi:hypothetical protein